jgi:hypothetical protein
LSIKKLTLDMSKIWLWVCFSKEKLTLDIIKYDIEYNDYHIYININVWYNYNFKNFVEMIMKYKMYQSSPVSQECSLHSFKSSRGVGVEIAERDNIL